MTNSRNRRMQMCLNRSTTNQVAKLLQLQKASCAGVEPSQDILPPSVLAALSGALRVIISFILTIIKPVSVFKSCTHKLVSFICETGPGNAAGRLCLVGLTIPKSSWVERQRSWQCSGGQVEGCRAASDRYYPLRCALPWHWQISKNWTLNHFHLTSVPTVRYIAGIDFESFFFFFYEMCNYFLVSAC